jgi:hypothetical protein
LVALWAIADESCKLMEMWEIRTEKKRFTQRRKARKEGQ